MSKQNNSDLSLFTYSHGSSTYFRPPEGCLQYLTGLTGRVETFNFKATAGTSTHLRNQE